MIFLIDYLILYIEREIATKFIIESIMYNFWDSKELKCVCVYLYILDNSMVSTLGECEIWTLNVSMKTLLGTNWVTNFFVKCIFLIHERWNLFCFMFWLPKYKILTLSLIQTLLNTLMGWIQDLPVIWNMYLMRHFSHTMYYLCMVW